MPTLPIVFTTPEDSSFLADLGDRIKSNLSDKASEVLLKYPIVYIHYWLSNTVSYVDRRGVRHSYPQYDIYVGESIDVLQRTRQHYDDGNAASSASDAWQYDLVHNSETPQFIVVGHEHFNKSFTLDVENRLIEYVLAMQKTVRKSLNGRGNPQNSYFPSDEFDNIFSSIWTALMRQNPSLFVSEAKIKDSAIFKASPLKKLTAEQNQAKDAIIAKVISAYNSGRTGQLIFVQGEAGTGKTVLTTSTFYELIKRGELEPDFPKLNCHLLVNHDQQAKVYEQMVKRLGFDDASAGKPTRFINSHSPQDKVDVAFIDEGHLLWTQGKQSYRGKNQLRDIIDRARVTVIMFDEYQVLNSEEYWEPQVLDSFKQLSRSQGNYILLKNQLRMECSPSTVEWINEFVVRMRISAFLHDSKYEVKLFDSPAALHSAIKAKASSAGTELSRVVATYDWEYKKMAEPEDGRFWDVTIGDWSMPWNYEREKMMTQREKHAISHLAWAEQAHTIDEVGSTYTIQGFDLSYVGVILGPSVKYRNGGVVFDPKCSKNEKAKRNRTLSDHSKASFGPTFIRNEVKVLLTRGVKGLYVYACDPALQNALKTIAQI